MPWIFLFYFFLEVVVTIQIGGAIGGLATFGLIVLSAVVGFWILRNFKSILGESLVGVMQGSKDMKSLMRSNLLTLVGAILLIIPGFLSDMIGLAMQLGFVTTFLTNRFGGTPSNPNAYYDMPNKNENSHTQNKGNEDVIDVEIIEPSGRINK